MYFSAVQKRDGRTVDFDAAKITEALLKAGKATGEFEEREARRLTMQVLTLAKACESSDDVAFHHAAHKLQLSSTQINSAHLQALAWTDQLATTPL